MRRRILVVDDDRGTVFFLGENLAELGPEYQVETASSGQEALDRFSVQPFDLIISDLRMPGMDGLELFREIRRSWPRTQLILMTAYSSKQVEEQARQLGVFHYITKPFRVEALINAVQQALESPAGQVATGQTFPGGSGPGMSASDSGEQL